MARIKGSREYIAKLKKLRADTAPKVRPAMAEAAQIVVNQQKRLAPVDDGDLRNSIVWSFAPPPGADAGADTPTKVYITAGDPPRVRHAAFVEFGTSSMRAQPYFFPGYRSVKKVKAIINRAIGKAVREAVR